MDVGHDLEEFLIDLFPGPGDAGAVLGHFEAGYGYPAGVGRLGRAEENAFFMKELDPFPAGGHVSPFGYNLNTVGYQVFSVLLIDLVLGGARQGTIGFVVPEGVEVADVGIMVVLHIGVFLLVFADSAPLDVLQVLDELQFLFIDPVAVKDIAG